MTLETPQPQLARSPLELKEIISGMEDLPSIPETLIEILKVLDDPDSGPSDLADVVRLDAPLMAKVLRLANSPYYSARGDIADINRCVSVLGYRTVRQVAICITVATTLVAAVAKSRGRLDYRELWRHSVVTAAISKHLAQMVDYPDPEEIFTSGLLHDIGKFVLEIHAPEIYDRVVQSRSQQGRPLVEMEEETFGFSHAAIGRAFGESWRFPEIMVRVFGDHHQDLVGGPALDRGDKALALVALGNYLANTMEPPRSDLGFDPRLANPVHLHECANLTVAQVEENLEQIRESVRLASAFLDLS
jgi:putative nucleotidyltransferase with HDIG domain